MCVHERDDMDKRSKCINWINNADAVMTQAYKVREMELKSSVWVSMWYQWPTMLLLYFYRIHSNVNQLWKWTGVTSCVFVSTTKHRNIDSIRLHQASTAISLRKHSIVCRALLLAYIYCFVYFFFFLDHAIAYCWPNRFRIQFILWVCVWCVSSYKLNEEWRRKERMHKILILLCTMGQCCTLATTTVRSLP